jgi:hypothetical protein
VERSNVAGAAMRASSITHCSADPRIDADGWFDSIRCKQNARICTTTEEFAVTIDQQRDIGEATTWHEYLMMAEMLMTAVNTRKTLCKRQLLRWRNLDVSIRIQLFKGKDAFDRAASAPAIVPAKPAAQKWISTLTAIHATLSTWFNKRFISETEALEKQLTLISNVARRMNWKAIAAATTGQKNRRRSRPRALIRALSKARNSTAGKKW